MEDSNKYVLLPSVIINKIAFIQVCTLWKTQRYTYHLLSSLFWLILFKFVCNERHEDMSINFYRHDNDCYNSSLRYDKQSKKYIPPSVIITHAYFHQSV